MRSIVYIFSTLKILYKFISNRFNKNVNVGTVSEKFDASKIREKVCLLVHSVH